MKLLFLGHDDNHLKVINNIKKNHSIDMVDYNDIQLSNVFIKSIDEINLENYKIIFISDLLFNNYIKNFKDYNGKSVIFKGLSKIELNDIKIHYLVNELSLRQNTIRPNIFICGYGRLGNSLSRKLLSMGFNVRVGVTSKKELYDLLQCKISCIYTTNNDIMASLIENDEFIINTTPNKFSPKTIEKIHNYLADINDYDIKKENDFPKTYTSK
jgi:hypothetical protein